MFDCNKNKLDALREKIDIIDHDIAKLLKQRLTICEEVKKIKNNSNIPITDLSREETVLSNVTAHAETQAQKNALKAIYQVVIKECTNLQK